MFLTAQMDPETRILSVSEIGARQVTGDLGPDLEKQYMVASATR